MKTLDDWSDFEISIEVTSIAFGCKGWCITESGEFFYHCGVDGSQYFVQVIIDSCNSWADMGPIMLKNGIGMVAENGKLIGATTSSQQYYEPYGDIIYSYNHVNPLRAAAIVFLMMNGVNPE